jgi:hypothetical protein
VYTGHKWAFIEEHIHDMLGTEGKKSGDLDAALHHYAAMINCPHSPPYWQAHHLRQFLEVIGLAINQRVSPLLLVLVHCSGFRFGIKLQFIIMINCPYHHPTDRLSKTVPGGDRPCKQQGSPFSER